MLQIEIAKQPDGAGILRCTRHDGSITWQKQTKRAAHFALHDLTHYAVETALSYFPAQNSVSAIADRSLTVTAQNEPLCYQHVLLSRARQQAVADARRAIFAPESN